MGQWTADQQIVGEGAEYVHIDEVNAIIAAADRRTEMHECAMEERDDCIEDWSKANDQICRLTAELDAMRDALKPLTVQDAARVLLISPDRGVCVGGRWDGWLMIRHPDGHWVSQHKLDAVDLRTEMTDALRAIAEVK